MNMMIHGRPATLAALLRTPETRDAVAGALSGIATLALRTHMGTLNTAAAEALLRDQADVMFVEVDLAAPAEVAALEALKARCPPYVPLLVTTQSPSMDGMRQLLRLGIADLQPQPIDANLLLDGIHNAIRMARSRSGGSDEGPRGTVTAFLKAGGGVGATSLAVNCACALVKAPREAEADTCLLDFDIQFGAIATHLDIEHATSLVELVDNSGRFDRTLLRSAMARHPSGIDVLPAPNLLHPLDMVTPEAASILVQAAALDYRHVLVDLPTSWTAWTRAALAEASVIVLVLRPDVPSICQARRQIETLAAEGCGDIPLVVVANFCASGPFAQDGIDLKEAARALGRPIDHIMDRADRIFSAAANEGLPLAQVKGGRRVAKRVARLMDAIVATAKV